MNRTPPTGPLGPGAPTRMQSGSGSRSPFSLTVGCASVILGLVLGIGGFFSVRAVTDVPTEPAARETPTVLETAPVGRSAAIPLGTTFPYVAPDSFPGEAEIAVTEVDGDATEEVAAASESNGAPDPGTTYIEVLVDVAYHGDGVPETFSWIEVQYVGPDGGNLSRTFVVTEQTGGVPVEVADGESFQESFVFTLPQDAPENGHFVITDDAQSGMGERTWIEAA